MAKFASQTTVTVEKSRAEVERELVRFGASGFTSGWQEDRALIEFIYKSKKIRFVLELPARKDFMKQPSKSRGIWNDKRIDEAREQAKRQRWRSLALIVKAKLVAVTDDVHTFETEFMPHIVMPDDRTVAEHVRPHIEQALLTQVSPQRLLGAGL
jgi:hypothetical protein